METTREDVFAETETVATEKEGCKANEKCEDGEDLYDIVIELFSEENKRETYKTILKVGAVVLGVATLAKLIFGKK